MCTAQGKKSLAELKCNSYANAKNREYHGSKPLSRSRESAFLLRVIQTVESNNFQYRGQSISLEEMLVMVTDSAFTFNLHVYMTGC